MGLSEVHGMGRMAGATCLGKGLLQLGTQLLFFQEVASSVGEATWIGGLFLQGGKGESLLLPGEAAEPSPAQPRTTSSS